MRSNGFRVRHIDSIRFYFLLGVVRSTLLHFFFISFFFQMSVDTNECSRRQIVIDICNFNQLAFAMINAGNHSNEFIICTAFYVHRLNEMRRGKYFFLFCSGGNEQFFRIIDIEVVLCMCARRFVNFLIISFYYCSLERKQVPFIRNGRMLFVCLR